MTNSEKDQKVSEDKISEDEIDEILHALISKTIGDVGPELQTEKKEEIKNIIDSIKDELVS